MTFSLNNLTGPTLAAARAANRRKPQEYEVVLRVCAEHAPMASIRKALAQFIISPWHVHDHRPGVFLAYHPKIVARSIRKAKAKAGKGRGK